VTIRGKHLKRKVEGELADRVEYRTTRGRAWSRESSRPDDPEPPDGDGWIYLDACVTPEGDFFWFWARWP
jgi:hypothetical protein